MATWVPVDQRTAHWYLFHRRYCVYVNEMQYRGVEHIKKFGVVMSGNEEYDSTVSKRVIKVMLTVAEMADLFAKQIFVSLVTPSDAKDIYQNVQSHITTWVEHMSMAYSTNNFPLEDLVALDEFASVVYPHAVKYFSGERVSELRNRLYGGASNGLTSIGRLGNWRADGNEKQEEKPKPKVPQRIGFADQFNKAIRKRDFPRRS